MKFRARTIRMRLTLIYGVVFLLTGGLLLTVGYLLVRHNLDARPSLHQDARRYALKRLYPNAATPPPARQSSGDGAALREAQAAGYAQAASDALHRLLAQYIAALAVMTGVSVGAGWMMAGRALAPLRAITATARRVSSENLGERIALEGPADELKELADTFDGMLSRLDSAFESQRHFVANASHELRTPLAIMRTEVDVTLADPRASVGELRSMGEALRETIDRSEALIAALLTLARSEAISGRDDRVDLAAQAGDCITDLQAAAKAAGVEIDADLHPAAVRGDAELLERMLANLIDNGIRHNTPGGRLRVRTQTAGQAVEVTVTNGGAVIEPEQLRTLTEPFRRVSRKPGGFGLGLSIVRSVAEAHRGSVKMAAPAAGGLEVMVTLPAAPAAGNGAGRKPAGARRQQALTRS